MLKLEEEDAARTRVLRYCVSSQMVTCIVYAFFEEFKKW
jgi:hypothetical protein